MTEKVHVGIERNRAIPTKWRQAAVVDAWAVHGIWWIEAFAKEQENILVHLKINSTSSLTYMSHPIAGRYPIAVTLPIAVTFSMKHMKMILSELFSL